jgi:hypothetical protein
MSADRYDASLHLGQPQGPPRALRRWWGVTAIALVAAVFIEAVFAGAMLSGAGWARPAHAATALLLVVSSAVAGLIGLFTLRRVPHGLRFSLTLMSLAIVLFVQMALGRLSAHGAGLLWLHVPVGVALVGLAMQAAATARRLGGE